MLNLFKIALRYLTTIRHLRFSQLFFRLFYYFNTKQLAPKESKCRFKYSRNFNNLKYKSHMHPDLKSLKILNHIVLIENQNLWKQNYDHLIQFNIHYFDYLNSIDAIDYKDKNLNLIYSWIDKNKQIKGSAWSPYTTSLRIINWIKFLNENDISDKKILDSLLKQTFFLSNNKEYDLLANHLFSNLKALFFSGLFLEFKNSNKLLEKTIEEIKKQIKEQVLPDGCHYEQSPMYHNAFLFDLIEIYSAVECCKNKSLKDFKGYLAHNIQLMYHAATIMSHPDGEPSYFNDSTIDVYPNLLHLNNFIKMIGLDCKKTIAETLVLEDGGFYKKTIGDKTIIAKFGGIKCNYQPGHTNADISSYELSLNSKRFILNTGITTYELGNTRDFERSSTSKNAVTIQKQSSSDTWMSFRVARRATNIKKQTRPDGGFELSYCGFSYLPYFFEHRRKFYLDHESLEIFDEVKPNTYQSCTKIIFSPLAKIKQISNKKIEIKFYEKKIHLVTTNPLLLQDTYVSGGFYIKKKCVSVIINMKSSNSYKLIFK